MRMAHLYPERKLEYRFPTHHEIHLREMEAVALSAELQSFALDPEQFPLLNKIRSLLGNRNSDYERPEAVPAKVTYSYPSGRSTTLAEVSSANAEKAKGEKVRWEPTRAGWVARDPLRGDTLVPKPKADVR